MSPTPMDLYQAGDSDAQPQGVPPFNDDILTLLMQETMPGTGVFEMGEDGEMHEVSPEDDYMPVKSSTEFAANLAMQLDDGTLAKLASDLIEDIDADIESRQPWTERFRRGFEMMGLTQTEMDDGPFPGSCSAVMPVLSEAIVQFWARALAELVPSEGPAKGATKGKSNKANDERAKRVADYLNHELMFLDRSWYPDMSRLLFALPFTGSCFKKVYRDYDRGRNCSPFVQAEDFICNYAFTDLDSAPRYTHRIWRTPNELKKAMVAGIYADVSLSAPSLEELSEEAQIRIEASDFEAGGVNDKSSRHELYEVYCDLVLKGDERNDGVARPYTITIERQSGKILAIYRAWKEQDPLERRRLYFVKYDYLPGPGFYGFGLLHMIGGLQDAATGALRAILDGAATASLQGGFMSEDAAIRDQAMIIEPGVWKKVNATAEDLQKAFFTPPFKEPSPVLFQIMGYIVQRAEKFAATTEMMTGAENSKNMPVGSTVAMIEQGGKVFSTIHRGLHKMLGEELRMRFDLIQEFAPQEGYPYDVEGAHEGLMIEDFAPGVSVVPVSDPNIFSQAQRIALNQAVYDIAQQNPDIVQRPIAVRRVLEGLNVPNIDELLVETTPPPPAGPVSQVQALLRGEPVQAYPDQDHEAHIQHLAAFANNPQFGANPQVQQQIGPALAALLGQHLAYLWATHARAMGVPEELLPPVMGDGRQAMGGEPPPQGALAMGDQQAPDPQQPPQVPPPQDGSAPPEFVARMAAQIAPQMAQVPGLPAPPSPQDAKAEADMQLKQKQLEQKDREIALKEQDAAAKQQTLAEGQSLKTAETNAKLQTESVKQAEAMAKAERAQHEAEAAAAKTQAANERAQQERERASMQAMAMGEDMRRADEQHQVAIAATIQKSDTDRTMAKIKGAVLASKAEQDAATKREVALKNQEVSAELKRKAAAEKPKATKKAKT